MFDMSNDRPTPRTTFYTDDEIILNAEQYVPGTSGGWFLSGIYSFGLDDLIDNDLEGWLDMLCMSLVGHFNVLEPDFTPLYIDENGAIVGRITACVDPILEELEEAS